MNTNLKTHDLYSLNQAIMACEQCPRLRQWCRHVADEKVKRFLQQSYWGKAVPSFGDPQAQLLIVGLAPAAHGANRTGRMFTGDKSGDWLYRALYKAGFANQPESIDLNDGLVLNNCYITAVCHCAPPENKPSLQEMKTCGAFLTQELTLMLPQLRVIVALGKIAFDTVKQVLKAHPEFLNKQSQIQANLKIPFSHGAEIQFTPTLMLIGSYHPSQQNTFTGKLTEPMFDTIFIGVKSLLKQSLNVTKS